MAKTLPKRAELVDYNHAVAGHDGTLSDVNGELFIKPCTQAEVEFYESSIASHADFAEYMPAFLGTLSLDEQTNGTSIEEQGAALLAKHHHDLHLQYHHHNGTSAEHANGDTATSQNGTAINGIPIAKHNVPEVAVPVKTGKRIVTNLAVVLENASHGFQKPNIMDVKLGVRLWADDAPLEKQIRFNKVSEETTHKDLGFRVAGMRVWQGHNAVGKGIDGEGYKSWNKDYGRYDLNKDNVHSAFENFLFSENAGVDQELGKLIAQAFLADLEKIEKVLAGQESRMFSASLLFVFEGDGKALRSAMEEASKPVTNGLNGHAENGNVDDEVDDEDCDSDDIPQLPKIYSVKVIDFAHATWTPGLGPDENSLLGVRSVTKILEKIVGV